MTALESWQRQAEAALATSEWGEDTHHGLRALAAEAQALWPTLDVCARQAVLQALRALAGRLAAAMAQTEEDLARCAQRRVGVRGYGQIQSCHRGQRLRRRA
jgi:hypothetical protein